VLCKQGRSGRGHTHRPDQATRGPAGNAAPQPRHSDPGEPHDLASSGSIARPIARSSRVDAVQMGPPAWSTRPSRPTPFANCRPTRLRDAEVVPHPCQMGGASGLSRGDWRSERAGVRGGNVSQQAGGRLIDLWSWLSRAADQADLAPGGSLTETVATWRLHVDPTTGVTSLTVGRAAFELWARRLRRDAFDLPD